MYMPSNIFVLILQQKEEQKDNVLRERRNSFNTPGTNGNSPESQLKYENDKLKLALAQRFVSMLMCRTR